jgi:hypothetical protein
MAISLHWESRPTEERSQHADRADRIGEFWGNPESRTFAELLIDCEEDRTLRAVLVCSCGKGAKVRLGSRAHREPHGEPAV